MGIHTTHGRERVCAVSVKEGVREKYPCKRPVEYGWDDDDHKWCSFHLPLFDKEGTRTEKMDWPRVSAELKNLDRALSDYKKKMSATHSSEFPAYAQIPAHSESSTLEGATIRGVGLVFGGKTTFSVSTIVGEMCFQECVFHGPLTMTFASVTRIALEKCIATGPVSFIDKPIGAKTRCLSLSGTELMAPFKVGGTACVERLDISNATFYQEVSFGMRQPMLEIKAVGAHFKSKTSFSRIKLDGPLSMNGVTFEVAPNFHDMVIPPDTAFPEISGFRDSLELMTNDAEMPKPAVMSYAEAERNYRYLMAATSDVKDRNYQGMFFILQQRAAQRQLKRYDVVRIVASIYDRLSLYGQSIGRPFASLVVTNAIAFLTYLCIAGLQRNAWDCKAALAFTSQQLFNPFSIWRTPHSEAFPIAGLRSTVESLFPVYVATAQSLLTLLFLYFLGLGIRWKFRKI